MQGGRPEEEGDHHPLPGDAERDSGPDRGAQQPKHQAVPGEQRPGREAQRAHLTIRPTRGGTDPFTRRAQTNSLSLEQNPTEAAQNARTCSYDST